MEEAIDTCRILIVDDSDFSRKSISEMLTSQKYKIIGEASNGAEAINILKESETDIAIIDIVMPDISGLELAEFIKHNFRNIQIILISSLAQENIIIDAIAAGANDFIQKPISKNTLISSVEKIFAGMEKKETSK